MNAGAGHRFSRRCCISRLKCITRIHSINIYLLGYFWHVSFLMVCISACVFLYISPPWLVSFHPVSLTGLCLFIHIPSLACVFLLPILDDFLKKRHMLLHTSKYFTTFALDFSSFHFWNKHEPSQKLRQLK